MHGFITALLISSIFYGCSGGSSHPDVTFGSSSSPSTSTSQAVITLVSVSPMSGPTTGGTSVTVTGTNFPTTSALTVNFGTVAATSVLVNSPTSATVTTPVHAAGTVDVSVSISGGTPVTLMNGFQFFPPGTTLQISTTTLPDLVKGTVVNQPIVPIGGNGSAQAWSITSGSLPAGLTISSTTGLITGTANTPGTSNFTVSVTDQTGTATKALSWRVVDILGITTTSPLNAVVNGAFSQAITLTPNSTSGTPNFTVSAGALPAGLTLNAATGVLSGTPTATGAFAFTIKVADALQTATMSFTMNVANPISFSGAVEGKAYSFAAPKVGGGSSPAFSASGLPSGLSIDPTTGIISGTPTTPGGGTFTVTITTMSSGVSASGAGFLIVSPATPVVGNNGSVYAGEVPPNLDLAATSISACGALNSNTSYILTADIGPDPTAVCLTLNPKGVRLDLNGHTVTGRIVMCGACSADVSGTIIFNGTVNCNWTDSGGDAGCVKLTASGVPASAQARIHHLTIANSGGQYPGGLSGGLACGVATSCPGARSIHVDWKSSIAVTTIVLRIFNITSVVSNQPDVVRSHNINVTGEGALIAEISDNDLTCNQDAAACQGIVCDQVTDCRMHANSMNMIFNTTAALFDTSRAMAFDTVAGGEAWNNTITVNNNRAVRVRDSAHIDVHDNTFNKIRSNVASTTFPLGSTAPYVAAVHLADPDAGTDDLHVTVQRNTFQMDNGRGIFIRNGMDADISDNTVTCSGDAGSSCTGLFAVARAPQVATAAQVTACQAAIAIIPKPGLVCDGSTYLTIMTFESNDSTSSLIPASSSLLTTLPSPQIWAEGPTGPTGAQVTVCKSGTAGKGIFASAGTITTSTTCP